MIERRMTNTGTYVDIVRRVPPAQMTDAELKKKLCDQKKGCAECKILYMCKYGKEWARRSAK